MKRLILEKAIYQLNKPFSEFLNDLGLSEDTINQIILCKKEPNWSIVQKLSLYFSIPAETLFAISDSKANYYDMVFSKKRLYSVDEFRKEIMNNQISKATIYAKIRSGELKAIKIGKRPFIPSEVVEELLTSYH